MRRRGVSDLDGRPMKVHTADAVAVIVAGMPPEHLHCRDMGHAWSAYTAKRLPGRGGGFESVLRCARCGTFRVRTLTRTGAVLTNRYEYPEEYLIAGLGRLTGADRDAVRLAAVLSVEVGG